MWTTPNIRTVFPPPYAELIIYANATLLCHSVAPASHYWSVMFPAPGPKLPVSHSPYVCVYGCGGVYVCVSFKSVCKLLSTSQGVGSHWISSELAKHQIAAITMFGVCVCVQCRRRRARAADISRNKGKH